MNARKLAERRVVEALVVGKIGSDDPDLESLIQALEQTSPIRDTIANPVTVTTRLR